MSFALVSAAMLFAGAAPAGSTFYGDTRTVTALTFAPSGNLVAATKGGLVSFAPGKAGLTFGWDGLIEGRGPEDVWTREGSIFASGGDRVARWDGTSLTPTPGAAARTAEPVSMGEAGFIVPERPSWPDGDVDPFRAAEGNQGTHVSVVAGNAKVLVAAWYGDGLWKNDGRGWERLPGASRSEFKEVRSLAMQGDDLALATYSGEVWWRHRGRWAEATFGNGPGGSVYSLAAYRGKVMAGTFEDGLAVFEKGKWRKVSPTLTTTINPRDMVVYRNRLYVRQTTGEVDRFDGRKWTKNIFPWLPRGGASCLAIGDGKLLIGQFGGWSEFDGSKWTHFLHVEGLSRSVATALAARKDEVWMGTQERGVGVYDRRQKSVKFFDMRQGLGDDWVRRISLDHDEAVLGLFLFGAFRQKGDAFEGLTPEVEGEASGLVRTPRGRLLVGSRDGLWAIEGGSAKRIAVGGQKSIEIQAMLSTSDGLWLGLPHGAVFTPWREIE
jgi:hypothetical protein